MTPFDQGWGCALNKVTGLKGFAELISGITKSNADY
jgi:hypothetical protein